MGCGCKNKANSQPKVEVQKENAQKAVSNAIQKQVEKYYAVNKK
jgi:hypothetical protein|tara:strand:- start:1642 stop:1773 length:132 start_codon:yes stop_codon:yes gene_type:complete